MAEREKGSAAYYVSDSKEIKQAISWLKKSNGQIKKENEILANVNFHYTMDYLPEASSTWSSKQWKNWWKGNKIDEVKKKIKEEIEKKHPRREYSIYVIKSPTVEALEKIEPGELAVCLKSKTSFLKSNNTKENK